MTRKRKMRIITGAAVIILAGIAGIYGINKHNEKKQKR